MALILTPLGSLQNDLLLIQFNLNEKYLHILDAIDFVDNLLSWFNNGIGLHDFNSSIFQSFFGSNVITPRLCVMDSFWFL